MKDFTIMLTGKKENDGTGRIEWNHLTDDGAMFGDHVDLLDYDRDCARTLPLVAGQTARLLEVLYGGEPGKEEQECGSRTKGVIPCELSSATVAEKK